MTDLDRLDDMAEKATKPPWIDIAEFIAALVNAYPALSRELRELRKKADTSLANNLCPDHRDKQQGKPCLACEEERLSRELREARATFAKWPSEWVKGLEALQADNAALRAELDRIKTVDLMKSQELPLKGMESQADLNHELKQENRTLRDEVLRLKDRLQQHEPTEPYPL